MSQKRGIAPAHCPKPVISSVSAYKGSPSPKFMRTSSSSFIFLFQDLGTERSIAHQNTSGTDGGFANPETGSVTPYSSRGPCYVDSGGGLETRRQPVITAATGLQTSTNPGT